ncbi:MAG: hypothetical protein KBF88_06025 [Polyangiaceae bacterium]|nr:hypothetical protein [Polyangiaceae bacterium]
MPLTLSQSTNPAIAGPLGSLALSVVRAEAPTVTLRSLRWFRDLIRLGVALPFFVIHDLGLVFAVPHEQLSLGTRVPQASLGPAGAPFQRLAPNYLAMVREIFDSEVSKRAHQLRLSDDLVVVLLARILAPLSKRMTFRAPPSSELPIDLELIRDLESSLPALFNAVPRAFDQQALAALVAFRLHLLTHVDALDLDTLRLLGMLGPESGAAGSLAHVDLLSALSSATANDIVNFSLELLPTVLETRRTQSLGTFSADGYAGLGNKGSLDSLVLSELGWDETEFARRFIDNELLYYAREVSSESSRRLHIILIDASASMRGDREVFARGLAVALAKKLQLQGEDVWLRFFDSRLYDVHRPKMGQLPIASLLAFRGERGRNPARVFSQLATELNILRTRDKRDPVVHLLTHASLHVPRPVVQEIVSLCTLQAVFMMPSQGELRLNYLDLLSAHTVVDAGTLTKKEARSRAAAAIVEEGGGIPKGNTSKGATAPKARGLRL